MSTSDWLFYIAIGITVAWSTGVGFLGHAYYASRETPSIDRYCQSHEQTSRANEKGTATSKRTIKNTFKNEIKGDPARQYKEYDLCQQWRMAEAAQEAVRTAWFQAFIGLFGLSGLLLTVYYTARSAWAAADAAIATKASVDVAQKAIVAQERPWVSIDLEVGSSLVFKDGDGQITISFTLRNYGTSPATNVEVKFEILPLMQNGWDRMTEITNEAKNRPRRQMIGHKIFPGQKFSYDTRTLINKNDIESAYEKLGVPNHNWIFPVIVGCVVYNSALDDENHTNEFYFHLGKRDDAAPHVLLGIHTMTKEIPADKLRLMLSFGGGNLD